MQRVFSIVAMVAVVGCSAPAGMDGGSGSGGVDSDDAGEVDAGNLAELTNTPCLGVARAVCERGLRCGQVNQALFDRCLISETSNCLQLGAAQQLNSQLTAGMLTVDVPALRVCLAEYDRPCADRPDPCEVPTRANAGTGGQCRSSENCRVGFCNRPGDGCGSCEAVRATGAECNNEEACGEGSFCSGLTFLDDGGVAGTCALLGEVGSDCVENYECRGYCDMTMKCAVLTVGQSCATFTGCQSSFCSLGTMKCEALVAEGGACAQLDPNPCVDGFVCRDAKCQRPATSHSLDAGQQCRATVDCAFGATCVEGVCVTSDAGSGTSSAAGESCGVLQPCMLGLECSNPDGSNGAGLFTCKPRPENGERCGAAQNCVAATCVLDGGSGVCVANAVGACVP